MEVDNPVLVKEKRLLRCYGKTLAKTAYLCELSTCQLWDMFEMVGMYTWASHYSYQKGVTMT